MSHLSRIQDLKQKECMAHPSARFLVSKIFRESSVSAVERSLVHGVYTKEEVLKEAIVLIGDFDLSTTRFGKERPVEGKEGDPAMNAAIDHLTQHQRITLGDFTIEIDNL
jgi:hypothetical protein